MNDELNDEIAMLDAAADAQEARAAKLPTRRPPIQQPVETSMGSVNPASMKQEVYQLPSHGIPYQGINLVGGDSVMIRPMMVGDQRRAGNSGSDPYQIYSKLLTRTVVQPSMHNCIDDFLLSDCTAMLWAVRAMTWGPMYKIDLYCGGCNKKRKHDMDTGMLQTREADEVENYAASGIDVELDRSVVTIHLPKMRDIKMVASNVSKLVRAKILEADNEADKSFVQAAGYIDQINGKPVSLTEAFQFIEEIHQQDFDRILAVIDEQDTGVLPNQVVTCSCGRDVDIALTVTPEFFRPSK